MAFLITPAQLFEPRLWKDRVKALGINRVIVWEDPCFFGDRRGDAYGRPFLKLNRLRLAYTKLCCSLFCSKYKVERVAVEDLWDLAMKDRYKLLNEEVHLFDPCDEVFEKRLEKYVRVVYHDSPQWLASAEQLKTYGKGRTKLMHHHFYEWMKGMFPEVHSVSTKSQDVYNRNPLDDAGIVGLEKIEDLGAKRVKSIVEAVDWVMNHPVFRSYPGADRPTMIETLRTVPATHQEAMDALKDFIQVRFAKFGEYQDAMYNSLDPKIRYLYHSGISPMLNNGLLTPRMVLEEVYRAKNIGVASYEGFVRQILGWREYCRLYYRHFNKKEVRVNRLKAMRKLDKRWYEIREGDLIENTIAKAWRTGYLHHIERLMIVANWMTLHSVKPDDVYNWFYEFALDSYSWVMVFNVYSMGTWSDGGLAMRKPYISSSHYLMRMGRFSSKEPWVEPWNQSYKRFLEKNRDVLKHTVLANLV